MSDAVRLVRVELLTIIGAVGTIRENVATFAPADIRYFEDELSKVQSAAHRMLETLETIEQQRH